MNEDVWITNKTEEPLSIPPVKPEAIPELIFEKAERRLMSMDDLRFYDYVEFQKKGALELQIIPPKSEEKFVNLVNQTARRIKVLAKGGENQLIIPAFGSRRISQSMLEGYDHEPWEQGNLIEISPEQKEVQTGPSDLQANVLTYTFVWLLFGIFLRPTLVQEFPAITSWYWPVYLGIALLGLLYGFGGGGAVKKAGQSLNLVLLLVISLGIPSLVIFFFGDGANLLQPGADAQPSQGLLGRSLQMFLITLLASLPGLLYFQYDRQQVTTLRDKYLREIMLLNPSVHTVEDAEIMYGSMVDEISGVVGASSRQYYLLGAGRPILLATLLITFGWLLTFLPVGAIQLNTGPALFDFLTPSKTAIVFAFLGTYFFALNLIFRRYARGDLTPKAYSHIVVRILSSIILVWVISVVANLGGSEANPGPVLLLVAFAVGIFPETGVVVLQDAIQKRGLRWIFSTLREQNPITRLEGVNLYDYVRLLEEGVENIENLAHYNLIELLLRSRLPTSRLVDLVDQAILYQHVCMGQDSGKNSSPGQRIDQGLEILHSYGIRTATDLVRVVNIADDKEKDKIFGLLGPADGNRPQRLKLILHAIQDDEWLDYLQYWRELNRSYGQVYSWEDFYSEEGMRVASRNPDKNSRTLPQTSK